MTQIAFIPVAPQQTATESPPVKNSLNEIPSENEFAPLLENAISEETELIPAVNSKNIEANNLTANLVNNSAVAESTLLEVMTKQTDTIEVIFGETQQPYGVSDEFAAISQPTIVTGTSFTSKQSTITGQMGFMPAPLPELSKEELPESTRNALKNTVLQPQTPGISNSTPLNIDINVNGVQLQTSQPSRFSENNTILQQLHLIINNSNETGTVSIEGTVNKYTLHAPGEADPKLSGFVFNQVHETEKIIDKPSLKNPTLRQDINGQYIEAKMNAREQGNNGSNTETGSQQSSSNSEQLSSSSPLNQAAVPEQSGSYQQISTLMQEIQNNQVPNSAKPITLPSSTVVYEEDVIQQLLERFQISRKPNDTRISLKLHPAELGELKIDITVKEGSIKAHVIAQSQHVQEMIERNTLKLRNALEDQGFAIEELLVTSESDSVTDFNLFEQNLSHQNNFTSPATETKNRDGFNSILEDAVEDFTVTSTGVNIKV